MLPQSVNGVRFLKQILPLMLAALICSQCSKKQDNAVTTPIVPPVDTTPVKPLLPYQLVWSDEFDSAGLPNPTKWGYDVGGNGWGNKEAEFYTASRMENARVENGNLVIEARKEAWQGNNYTSARLLTKNKMAWTYGRFEIRAKLPGGKGIWPAIWTLSAHDPLKWPDDGELDIMESVGYIPNEIYGTAHCQYYNGANGLQKGGHTTISTSQDSFHVYKMEWTPTQIAWSVDDVVYYVYPDPGYGIGAWPFNANFFMILNVAVGGNWGGAQGIDDSIFPQQMLIDYVRVYQRK
jgi:beta-glucanase (GH16 family)